MPLSATQIEEYGESGFVIARRLLSAKEVECLRADAVRLCRGEYPCPSLPPAPPEMDDSQAIGRYLCLHQPHRISPVIRDFVAHRSVAEVLTHLIGPDVKCMQSMLFLKPPGFPGQAWHQDEIYIPTRDRSLVGAWYALDDATVDNGCLWVLPGSHRSGYLYPQRDHDNPAEFDFAQESYGFDDRGEMPVEVETGDVVFFHGYLLHRSRKNRSDRHRRVLVNHYMNAWSLLPWQTAGADGEPVARADNRAVIMVAGTDPYEWKGYDEPTGVHVRAFDPSARQTS